MNAAHNVQIQFAWPSCAQCRWRPVRLFANLMLPQYSTDNPTRANPRKAFEFIASFLRQSHHHDRGIIIGVIVRFMCASYIFPTYGDRLDILSEAALVSNSLLLSGLRFHCASDGK